MLLCLLQSGKSFAQPEKGMWLVGSDATLGTNLNNDADNYYLQLNATAGYFLTRSLLLGASANAFRSYSRLETPLFDSRFSYNLLGAGAFARYYLPRPSKPFQYFIELGGSVQAERTQFSSLFTNQSESRITYVTFGSAGLNYFIRPNIAVEGRLRYRNAANNDSTRDLQYLIGMQFFIPNTMEPRAIGQPLVGKGFWMIGVGGLGGWNNIGDTDDLFGSIEPTVARFLLDKLAVGATLQLAFANENAIINPQPFVRLYLTDNDSVAQFFFNAGMGTRFQLAKPTSDPGFFGLNTTLGMGLGWFVMPGVAAETTFQYNARQIEESRQVNSLELAFGFQFFIK